MKFVPHPAGCGHLVWVGRSPTPLGVSFPHPFPSPLSLTHPKLKGYFCVTDLLGSSKNLQPPGWDSGISDSQKLENQWMRGAKKSPTYLLQVDLSFPGNSYGQAPSVGCTHTHTVFARILKWNVSMLFIGFRAGVDMVWIKTLYFSSAGQCLMVDSFLFYEVIIGPGFVKTIYYMSPKLQNSIKVVIQSMSPSFTFSDLPQLWWLRGSSVNERPLKKQ